VVEDWRLNGSQPLTVLREFESRNHRSKELAISLDGGAVEDIIRNVGVSGGSSPPISTYKRAYKPCIVQKQLLQ
jgi:hypothetical protein